MSDPASLFRDSLIISLLPEKAKSDTAEISCSTRQAPSHTQCDKDEGKRNSSLFKTSGSAPLGALPLFLFFSPQQKHTHRQRCALGKGFQHYGGECCHFPQHRTMVSAAVMITSTVTNPTVNQTSSLMAVPSFPFDSPGDRMWSWTFSMSASPPPP